MTGFKVKKISTPYLLLIPGMAFLFTFFLLPIFNLAQTSTQTPTGETGEYQQSLRFANYLDAFLENREQFGRSFLYATIATVLALAIAYPLAYELYVGSRYCSLLYIILAPHSCVEADSW
jgi:spermidine/putrescine transport system permease protein